MTIFFVQYELANSKIIPLLVNHGTFLVLKETSNKDEALRKQDRRHRDHRGADTNTARWAAPTLSLEEQYEQKELYQELYRAIDRLSDVQARRIWAYFFHEMSLEEIARSEGVTVRAVAKTICKGILSLRKCMKGGTNLPF